MLEGLTVALGNIEEMIELIKSSPTPAEAKEKLLAKRWNATLVRSLLGDAAQVERVRLEEALIGDGLFEDGYQLSEQQAKEILEMRLSRLTGLEQDKPDRRVQGAAGNPARTVPHHRRFGAAAGSDPRRTDGTARRFW